MTADGATTATAIGRLGIQTFPPLTGPKSNRTYLTILNGDQAINRTESSGKASSYYSTTTHGIHLLLIVVLHHHTITSHPTIQAITLSQ